MPRVSVITPFVDEGPFLAEAIASVRAQTRDDWELVLVDDGAGASRVIAGASRAIAERAAGEDRRIRVLPPDPAARGAAAARNRGVRAAGGDLIAFLDADDLFLPAKLAAEVARLDAHPEAAMLIAPTRWWFGGARWRDWTERPGAETERVHAPPALLERVLLRQEGDIPCTCGVLVRRRTFLAAGGFEERFALYEDQSLLAKVFLAEPVYVARAGHALYRQHAGSTSARAEASGQYDRYGAHAAQTAFFAWLADWIRARGADPGLLAALAAAAEAARRPPPGRVTIAARALARRLGLRRLR